VRAARHVLLHQAYRETEECKWYQGKEGERQGLYRIVPDFHEASQRQLQAFSLWLLASLSVLWWQESAQEAVFTTLKFDAATACYLVGLVTLGFCQIERIIALTICEIDYPIYLGPPRSDW
jgi:hypothetical protein